MKTITIFIMMFLVAGTLVVQAQNEQTIKITLKEAETNKEVKDVLVNIIVLEKASGSQRTISSFIKNNPIILRLDPADYKLTFEIDNLQTQGKDYYGEQEINLDKPLDQEVTIFPVGSVKGVVLDKLNNLVSKATLKIECSKDYGEKFLEETNLVGAFSLNYAPVGDCTIAATANKAAGTGKITITKGSAQNIEIHLDRAVVSEGISVWTIFFLIIIAGVLIAAVWFGWKQWQSRAIKTKEPERKQEEEKKQQSVEAQVSKRTKDILGTVNEKEKKIILFLLKSENQSTQAKIRYETGIPKTTLVRIFTSLQSKKIITIETMGKLKKIKLTDWFLDKEN